MKYVKSSNLKKKIQPKKPKWLLFPTGSPQPNTSFQRRTSLQKAHGHAPHAHRLWIHAAHRGSQGPAALPAVALLVEGRHLKRRRTEMVKLNGLDEKLWTLEISILICFLGVLESVAKTKTGDFLSGESCKIV